jgi:hypothetical protein
LPLARSRARRKSRQKLPAISVFPWITSWLIYRTSMELSTDEGSVSGHFDAEGVSYVDGLTQVYYEDGRSPLQDDGDGLFCGRTTSTPTSRHIADGSRARNLRWRA